MPSSRRSSPRPALSNLDAKVCWPDVIGEQLARGFAVATALALILTPLAGRVAKATGFWDRPGGHKSHRRPVPYLGGLAIVVAADAGAAAAGGLDSTTGRVLMVATLLAAVGLIDDRFPVHPMLRLGSQLCAGAVIWGAGIRFEITGSPIADGVFSLIWVVGVTNAFNLLDNMDGLCAGAAAIAALGAGAVALAAGQVALAATAAAVCGACVGFLAFNLRPATIFMGDAGSMFLGAAVAAIILAAHTPGPVSVRAVVPLLIIGLPLLDTLTVALARARRRISVLQGGQDHLSHRLVALGQRRRVAVRTLLVAQAVSVGGAVAVVRGLVDPWLGLAAAAIPLLMIWVRATRAAVYDDPVVGLPKAARWVMGGGAALVVIVSAPAALAMARARTPLQAGASAIKLGIQHEESGDTAAARQDFARAGVAFTTAHRRLGGAGVAAGGAIPVLAVNLRAATVLASVGVDLSRTGQELATGTDVQALRIQHGSVPVGTLRQLAPRLQSLSVQVSRSSEDVHRLPRTLLLPQIRRAVDELDSKLAVAAQQSRQSADAAAMVPALLGGDGQRRYLLLFQNNAEARATGGLIGNYGELLTQAGQISQGHFGRLVELNAPAGTHRSVPAPADYVARYAQFSPFDNWQNINLSPDFPTVGSVAAKLYAASAGSPVAGVIGIDPIALSDLLRLTGPIQVPPWPTAITADNVVPVTLQTAYDVLPNEQRITFLGDVAQAVFTAATSRDLGNPLRIAQALGPAVVGRHLQIYLTDPAEEAFAGRLGASGALLPSIGDRFLITTQNASANKVDYYLQRRVGYQLTLDPMSVDPRIDTLAHVQGTMIVELTNGAPDRGHSADALGPYSADLRAGENRTFFSAYTPLSVWSSTLDGKAVDLESGVELGQHVFSAFVDIPSGATRTIGLSVSGLIQIRPGGWYTLDLPRQPAIGVDHVTIALTVPSGWLVRSGSAGSGWGRRSDIAVDLDGPGLIRFQLRQTGEANLLDPVAVTPVRCPSPTGPPRQTSPC